MTRTEAIQAMGEGRKITHRYFSDNEYVYLDGKYYITEDGCKHDPDVFWSLRSSESWDDGYSIVED
jgi:hypothetical protein